MKLIYCTLIFLVVYQIRLIVKLVYKIIKSVVNLITSMVSVGMNGDSMESDTLHGDFTVIFSLEVVWGFNGENMVDQKNLHINFTIKSPKKYHCSYCLHRLTIFIISTYYGLRRNIFPVI